MSLAKLTVDQYQRLYAVQRSENTDLDKSIQSVAIITGKTPTEVEAMDFHEFKTKAKEIAVLFSGPIEQRMPHRYVKLVGKKYKVMTDIRDLSAGQYIDLQHFLAGNMIENLHQIFACLLIPEKFFGKGKYDGKNHEIISNSVLDLPFIEVHSTCVFFLKFWNGSIKAIQDYLNKEFQKNPNLKLNETDLSILMDGFII